jgi:Fe2+ or Zn2+ uptake regulation protein
MDNRHEGNTQAHIHLICKQCHNIIDIFPDFFDPNEVIKNIDFQVTDTRFEYYGYCTKCRDNKDQPAKCDLHKIMNK